MVTSNTKPPPLPASVESDIMEHVMPDGVIRVTPQLVRAFLRDTRMAAYVFFGIELAPFQAVRLRLQVTVPLVLDHSGIGTGKTLIGFMATHLLGFLSPSPRRIATYYQDLATAREIWEPYYAQFFENDLFRAQFPDDKNRGERNTRNALRRYARDGTEFQMPAGDFARDSKSAASRTFTDAWVDEAPLIEDTSKGLQKQILGRVRGSTFNYRHPVWARHTVLMGRPEDPATNRYYKRVLAAAKEIRDGGAKAQRVAVITSDFTDFPRPDFQERYDSMNEEMQRDVSVGESEEEILRKLGGINAKGGSAWYHPTSLKASSEKIRPLLGRPRGDDGSVFVLATDHATSEKDSADLTTGVVARARPAGGEITPTFQAPDGSLWHCSFSWAGEWLGGRSDQYAKFMRNMHERFAFSRIVMDSRGGGAEVYKYLRAGDESKARGARGGLATLSDHQIYPATQPIVVHWLRDSELRWLFDERFMKDDAGLNEAAHREFRRAVERKAIRFPHPLSALPAGAFEGGLSERESRALSSLTLMRRQLANLRLETEKTGEVKRTSRHGYLRWIATGKKDLAITAVYAYTGLLQVLSSSGD